MAGSWYDGAEIITISDSEDDDGMDLDRPFRPTARRGSSTTMTEAEAGAETTSAPSLDRPCRKVAKMSATSHAQQSYTFVIDTGSDTDYVDGEGDDEDGQDGIEGDASRSTSIDSLVGANRAYRRQHHHQSSHNQSTAARPLPLPRLKTEREDVKPQLPAATDQKRIQLTIQEIAVDPKLLPATPTKNPFVPFQLPIEFALFLNPGEINPARHTVNLLVRRRFSTSPSADQSIRLVPVQRAIAHVTLEKENPHTIANLRIDVGETGYEVRLIDPVTKEWYPDEGITSRPCRTNFHSEYIHVEYQVIDLDPPEVKPPASDDEQLRQRLEEELEAQNFALSREVAERALTLGRLQEESIDASRGIGPDYDWRPSPGQTSASAPEVVEGVIEWWFTPRYNHTSFVAHAFPGDLPPFETIPSFQRSKDPTEADEAVTKAWSETVKDHLEDKPEIRRNKDRLEFEHAWALEKTFALDSFEQVDPMRTRRDYKAVLALRDHLDLDPKELARIPGSIDTLERRRFKAEDDPALGPELARLNSLIRDRLGISLWELQAQSRSFTREQIVFDPPMIDICEMCGAPSCRLHENFISGNNPTIKSARTFHDPIASQAETEEDEDCGEDCYNRPGNEQEIIHHMKLDRSQSLLDAFSKCIIARPTIPGCILSLTFEIPCVEAEGIARRILCDPDRNAYIGEPELRRIPLTKMVMKKLPIVESLGYEPCNCEGPCRPDSKPKGRKTNKNVCDCVKRGVFCDRFCGCSEECARRFRGCECRLAADFVRCDAECPCRKAERECDPHLCANFNGPDKASGTNDQIRFGKRKATVVSNSTYGFGVRLLERAQKDDLIGMYGGEMFWPGEVNAMFRTMLQHDAPASYWFTLDKDHSIDPIASGNTMRFINDLPEHNCEPRPVYIDGTHQMGIYALMDLERGTELSINYGPNYWPDREKKQKK